MSRFSKVVLSACALATLAPALTACVVEPVEPRPYRDREVVVEHPRPHYCDRRDCW